jgi:hypothetical protein
MLSLPSASFAFSPAAVTPSVTPARVGAPLMETKADLQTLASELNPVVGYWDPLKLTELDLWGQGEEATIGWLREAEIKHGRIAMAGFLGYIVHSNDIRMQGMAPELMAIPKGISAPEVWDAMPEIAKWQIILFVGVMEAWRENKVVLAAEGQTHYMKGGKPGYYPTFDLLPHPVPFNLYDPWNVMADKTEAQKAKGRLVEINNGRLAMIGLFGFVAEAQVPGSVPFLKGIIPAYSGDVMQPFVNNVFTTYGTPLV